MNFTIRQPSGAAWRVEQAWAWARHNRWFVVLVLAPSLLAALYYAFVAGDIYVSEAQFVVKSPSLRQSSTSGFASLFQTQGLSLGQEQAGELADYLKSRSALADLQRRIDFRRMMMTHQADVLERFPAPWRSDSFEDLYRYYQARVHVAQDQESSTVTVTVEAFNSADAYRINAALLALGEDMANRLNQRAHSQIVAENESRLEKAQQRDAAARAALGRYRNSEQLFDPDKQAVGVLDVSNGLTQQQANLIAQLQTMSRLTPQNPAIPALRDRIAAVGQQIAAQNGRAAGTPSGLASKAGGYASVAIEQQFADQMLAAAGSALEQARSDAAKQQFYVERVVEPNLPDQPELPHRLRQVLVVFVSCLILYFIGWMLVVGILEHAPED